MVKELDDSSIQSYEYDDDFDSQLECPKSSISQSDNTLVFQKNDAQETSPTFGNISVTNGTDIHFGNKTFYQGPVTIQQFLYANRDKRMKDDIDDEKLSPNGRKKFDISDVNREYKTGVDNPICEEESVINTRMKNGVIKGNVATGCNTINNPYFEGHCWKTLLFEYRIAGASVFLSIILLTILAVLLSVILETDGVSDEKNSLVHPIKHDSEEDHYTPIKAPTGHCWKKLLFEYRIAGASVFLSIIVLTILAVLLTVILKTDAVSDQKNSLGRPIKHDSEEDHNTPIKAPTDPTTSLQPLKLKIVTRLEWLAQPPTHPANPLKTPVPYVIISHTATENCSSQAQCVFQVRYIQTFHLESRGWWDIGYNFLVGGDGEVYVGRGWDKEGAHTYGYNAESIGISFIGTFISSLPPEYQLIACKKLIDEGVKLGYIQKDYKLLGARQLQTTKSPGDALYKEIQTWPHWGEVDKKTE